MKNVILLTDEELLLEEKSIKNELLILDKKQSNLPHCSFVINRTQLNNQLEAIVSELDKRIFL